MAKTSVILTARDESGKDLQKSLTDINPDATNAQLMTFAQKLNSMTKNTYISTTRVDKINCDTEPGGGKLTPTISVKVNNVEKDTISFDDEANHNLVFATTTSDSPIYSYVHNPEGGTVFAGVVHDGHLFVSRWGTGTYKGNVDMTLYVLETDTYKAAERTITVTFNQ